MKSTWHLTLTDHFDCKITDNLSIFSHLLCRAFFSHDLNNRKIRLKQCDKLKLIVLFFSDYVVQKFGITAKEVRNLMTTKMNNIIKCCKQQKIVEQNKE